jgi:hypothetical protein
MVEYRGLYKIVQMVKLAKSAYTDSKAVTFRPSWAVSYAYRINEYRNWLGPHGY